MNAKIIITSFLLLIIQISFAQKEPLLNYEWFEEQSKIISDLQMKKTDLKNNGYDVSFPKDNFKVYYNDKLASQSYQYNQNDTQLVGIVEDVDFSKAIGLLEDNNIVYVVFPDNSLTIQVYGKDQSTTVKANSLDFYTNSDADLKKMFTTLYELITSLKIDKGLITSSESEKQWQDWQKLAIADFYIKYPNSLLAWEKNNIALEKVGTKYYKEQNYTEALKWYERAANFGNGYASYMIGHLYFNGYGVQKDYVTAKTNYIKGAEQGDINAMISAGQCYNHAWGVATDKNKAREFYQKAIDLGSVKALLNMGDSYYFRSNPEEFVEWYEKYINKGGQLKGSQMEDLGMAYFYNKKYQESLKWLKKACDEGERSHDIGITIREIYSKGLGGIEKDRKQGRYYWDICY